AQLAKTTLFASGLRSNVRSKRRRRLRASKRRGSHMGQKVSSGVVAAVAMAAGCAGFQPGAALAATQQPQPAPTIEKSRAFTAQELLALPESSWITNGGNLYNQRYSPLTLLNRDNIAGLKALWRTGMGSGAGPGNSGQAQILVGGDTLYVSNGAS